LISLKFFRGLLADMHILRLAIVRNFSPNIRLDMLLNVMLLYIKKCIVSSNLYGNQPNTFHP